MGRAKSRWTGTERPQAQAANAAAPSIAVHWMPPVFTLASLPDNRARFNRPPGSPPAATGMAGQPISFLSASAMAWVSRFVVSSVGPSTITRHMFCVPE